MKERDKKIIIGAAIFVLSIIFVLKFGVVALGILVSIALVWLGYMYISPKRSSSISIFENAHRIIEDFRNHGIQLDGSWSNIKGIDIPKLNLRLIWIRKPFNLTFRCDSRTGNVTGLKAQTLQQAQNEIVTNITLFAPQSGKLSEEDFARLKMELPSGGEEEAAE